MNLGLANQIHHRTRGCVVSDSWGDGSSLPVWPFQDGQGRGGKLKKQKRPDSLKQSSKAVARKRLGHFTVSSQEEQIASALHDHSGDWSERGLCLPRGSSNGMAWLHRVACALVELGPRWRGRLHFFAAGPFPPSFPTLLSHATLEAMMSSGAGHSRQPPGRDSLKNDCTESEI